MLTRLSLESVRTSDTPPPDTEGTFIVRAHVTDLLAETFGSDLQVDRLTSVAGGDINDAAVAETNEGQFFVKWNRTGPPDLFEREAEALSEMRDSGTELAIPEPIAVARPEGERPGMLVMEYLAPGTKVADFDERFGRGLARLHQKSADAFGFPHDNYCGTTTQPNDWTDDWVDFYREHRLGHQLRLAVDHRDVSSSDRRAFEQLLDRLDEFLGGEDASPALIHGDLWSGNLHVAPDGHPALIDPAAYYGHPEAEIGMMELFGGYSRTVYDAYQEVRPLRDGWRDRLELYSLYHVMNHYNLFGGHYGRRAFDIVGRWV